MGNIRFRTFDLGGHEIARKIWRDYFAAVDGVVFMVDSADRDRFYLVKQELDGLLNTEELMNVPFVIFGNKIDMPQAASEDELRNILGLPPFQGKIEGVRPAEVFMCSVARKQGYADGFKWLSQFLS